MNNRITIGSLFSGIDGLSLGIERALKECGYVPEVLFQVEKEPYAQKILARHWPHAARYDDVCTVGAVARERDDGLAIVHELPRVLLLCGGFPCQGISGAGKGLGLADPRSGLWFEFARIIGELRPRIVVLENVPMLLGRGLSDVLGNLASLRYDAVWYIVSAADCGAPQLRERVFIVAWDTDAIAVTNDGTTAEDGPPHVPDPCCAGLEGHRESDEGDRAGEVARGSDTSGVHRGNGAREEPRREVGGPNWPTPSASLFNNAEDPEKWLARAEVLKAEYKNGNGAGMPLAVAAKLAGGEYWQTPTVGCVTGGQKTRGGKRSGELLLNGQVAYAEGLNWSTPDSSENANRTRKRAPSIIDGSHGNLLSVEVHEVEGTAAVGSGFISPRFVEALMGFPDKWTDADDTTPTNELVWHGWPSRPNEPQRPWEAPRITHETRNRKARLKCLGNAVTPPQGECAGHVVAEVLSLFWLK